MNETKHNRIHRTVSHGFPPEISSDILIKELMRYTFNYDNAKKCFQAACTSKPTSPTESAVISQKSHANQKRISRYTDTHERFRSDFLWKSAIFSNRNSTLKRFCQHFVNEIRTLCAKETTIELEKRITCHYLFLSES